MIELGKRYASIVTAEMIGDDKLFNLLKEMAQVASNKIVLSGLKKGGKVINEEAKSNFMRRKKNKSKTNYLGFSSLFKVHPIKDPSKTGVKAGITGREGYKYRWQNYGTNERQYIKKGGKIHFTGKIQPTHFFNDAVKNKQEDANKVISSSIIESLKKIVEKNANNKSS